MQLDNFIIMVFCCVDEILGEITREPLRKRGFLPKLSDEEQITIEIIGEFLNLSDDKAIWRYFKQHWKDFFPALGSRSTFVRQSANLWYVKQIILQNLSGKLGAANNFVHIVDGFPLPICRFCRANFCRLFKGEAAYGYCATKKETYYGFKGHLLIDSRGVITGFSLTPSNVDERDVVPELTDNIKGWLIGDKGYIRPLLKDELEMKFVYLETPLRNNMLDKRPPQFVKRLNRQRRIVETVIGQLQDRFNIASSKARDLWHLTNRINRKLLAYTISIWANMVARSGSVLDFEGLVTV